MEVADLLVGEKLVLENGVEEELDKTSKEYCDKLVEVYNFEVEDFHTYFVGYSYILVYNKCGDKSWIKHDEYNKVCNKFGKKGVKRFVDAMKKGIVRGEGASGIKILGVKAKNGICICNKKNFRVFKIPMAENIRRCKKITYQQLKWLLDGLEIEPKKVHHSIKMTVKNNCF